MLIDRIDTQCWLIVVNVFFFKQKTAYEMLRSLVGSEMCIRDRYNDGTFRPDNLITRAEFVKILNKYFGLTNKSGKVFSDTSSHLSLIHI